MDEFERIHASDAGHAQVHEDQVKICGLYKRKPLFAILCRGNFKACLLQNTRQSLAKRRFIIYDEDMTCIALIRSPYC